MARRPFVSASARAAGITTEKGYQTWLAEQRGFKSYREQRRITGISLVQTLVDRAMQKGGMSRNEAASSVRQWWQDQPQPDNAVGSAYRGRSAPSGAPHSRAQGMRKRSAIKWAMDNGLYDDGDDAADDMPY